MKNFKRSQILFLIIATIILISCETNNKTEDKPVIKSSFQLVRDFNEFSLTKNDINKIRIDIKYGDSSALSMMLANDGTIGRQGSGSLPVIKQASMGVVDTTLFKELVNEFDEKKLADAGVYNHSAIKGDSIKYSLVLMGERPKIKVYEFYVGSESNEVGELFPYIKGYIEKAALKTDAWYKESLEGKK